MAKRIKRNWDRELVQLWSMLTILALTKGLRITYKLAGQNCKPFVHHRGMREPLGKIQTYCRDNGYPPLQIMVVNKETEVPGNSCYPGYDTWDEAYKAVNEFDWTTVPNPFVKPLE